MCYTIGVSENLVSRMTYFPRRGGESTSTLYVGLCGLLSVDMAVYLGQILNNLNRKILIADLTNRQALKHLFSQVDQFPVTYHRIDYVSSEFNMYAKENESYDIIFVCLTGDIRQLTGNRLSQLYYISDSDYFNVERMMQEIRTAKIITGIVFRDLTENGIGASYLLKYVCMDDYLTKLHREGRVYEIYDDLVDREYRIAMQYGAFSEFKKLSFGFLRVLECLAMEISGCEKHQVHKALKFAKEGKFIEEHHVLEQCIRKKRD